MLRSLDDIAALFARRGREQYVGEPVTQLQHALQTASLAEEDGADDALVTACLLHDVGHLLDDFGPTPTLRGVDDGHERVAAPVLRRIFPASVSRAVGLHVEAKRYLCRARADYLASLSEDSVRSLALQGGVMSETEVNDFLTREGAADAIRLRTWDDRAKVEGLATPSLDHFLSRAARLAHEIP